MSKGMLSVTPAKAGVQCKLSNLHWIQAFAGMTIRLVLFLNLMIVTKKPRLHLKLGYMGTSYKFLIIFTALSLSVIPAFAEEDPPHPQYKAVEDAVRRDAEDTIERARDSNFAAGKAAGERYKKDGPMWGQNYNGVEGFKEHPWKQNGNPDWWELYTKKDFDAMGWWAGGAQKAIFYNTCFDFHIWPICCDPACKMMVVGYWWPEAMVDLGNYCIGSHIGPKKVVDGFEFDFKGGCREDWLAKKKDTFDKEYDEKKMKEKYENLVPEDIRKKALAKDDPELKFPKGFREDPNIGQSHSDDFGFLPGQDYRFYEAHLFRPFIDVLQGELDPASALLAEASDAYLGAKVSIESALNPREEACFSKMCLPLNKEELFPRHWTEDMDTAYPGGKPALYHWRDPDYSLARFTTADAVYQELWSFKAPGDIVRNALRPGGVVTPGSLNVLQTETCASWRASDAAPGAQFWVSGEPIGGYGWRYPNDKIRLPNAPLDIKKTPVGDQKKFARNCLTSQATQVYPLVGAMQTNSERVGVAGAVRRMLEWASWSGFEYKNRINHFSDFTVGNQYRTMFTDKNYLSANLPPDKIQRIFPLDNKGLPSECVFSSEIDSIRYPRFWPKGINEKNYLGTTRFAMWNYRLCCVDLSQSTQGPRDEPKVEIPSTCIPMVE